MKARFFKRISLGLVLSALPFGGGCNQQSESSQSLLSAAQAQPALATANSTNALSVAPAAPESTPSPLADGVPVPAPGPTAGKALPPNIKPSSPLGEVVKLAQAGVDESVMLDFVRNSASLFSLGSDEIIYLNDIGAPSSVVTAMLQHDQALKQTRAEAAQAESAAAQATAQGAAPTYVNPPQPESPPAQTVETAAPPAPQPANVTDNYFYDSLSPYGSWVDVPGYGYCWQPTAVVVNRNWRPYSDGGRWIYSDSGWYWYSDYSWGWAPFHYGRWFSDTRYGWCWYPGYTWAPAWVNWRYSSGYCGWAPLPPAACYTSGVGFSYYGGSVGVSFGFGLGSSCYTFVPWGNFCGYKPYKYCASPQQAAQIYQNSTVINNYISGNNNTIINQGVPLDHVRRYAGTDIRPVSIRESKQLAGRGARHESLDRDGRTVAVYRPNIPAAAAGDPVPPRITSDSNPRTTPGAGAGSASQTEPTRGRGIDRPSRRQAAGSQFVATPRIEETRTATPSPPAVNGNSRVSPLQANSTPVGNADTTHGLDAISNHLSRENSRGNSRPSPVSPLATHGENSRTASSPTMQPVAPASSGSRGTTVNTPATQPATQKPSPNSIVMIGRRDPKPAQGGASGGNQAPTRSAPSTQKAPPGSLVMTGRRDSNPSPGANANVERLAPPARTEAPSRSAYNRGTTPVAQSTPSPVLAPQVPAPSRSTPAPPAHSYTRPVTATPRHERSEAPRQVASVSQPHSVPAPAPAPRAQYSAPVRSAPVQAAPAHVPSPRQAAPQAPSYSPPVSVSSPAASPTQSRPAPSSGASTSSSGSGRGGRAR